MFSYKKKLANSGFTLLELLVVIAIISILAAVIMLFVNTSRAKAQDGRAKAVLGDVRATAQEEKLEGSGYDAILANSQSKTSKQLTTLSTQNGETYQYYASADTFAVIFPLKSEDGYWCVDSSGAATKVGSTSITNGVYSCRSVSPSNGSTQPTNNGDTSIPIGNGGDTSLICEYVPPPDGCTYVNGPTYNPITKCGMILSCPSNP